MKLIADSGSTKTSWRFLSGSGAIQSIESLGINPFFRTSEDIEEELREKLAPVLKDVRSIYFYGAGIVDEEKAAIVSLALQSLFPNASIVVQSDLMGAVRSVCGNAPGVTCILGTGSNACFFDGNEIADQVPPLGFILGDEGSGTHLGKQLLSDFLKRTMPADIREKFAAKFDVSKEMVLERTYRQPKPNQFLASFTVFLSENFEEDYCRQLVRKSFQQFVVRNVLTMKDAKKLPVHFVGSIASVFQKVLLKVLEEYELTVGKIVKAPIDGLVEYHQDQPE